MIVCWWLHNLTTNHIPHIFTTWKKVDDPGDSSSTPCNDILEFISSKHYRRFSKKIAYLWHQTCMKIVEGCDTNITLLQHGEWQLVDLVKIVMEADGSRSNFHSGVELSVPRCWVYMTYFRSSDRSYSLLFRIIRHVESFVRWGSFFIFPDENGELWGKFCDDLTKKICCLEFKH